MRLCSRSVLTEQGEKLRGQSRTKAKCGSRLYAVAAVMMTLMGGTPTGWAQQVAGAGANRPDPAASELPAAPTPALTQPYPLEPIKSDFSQPYAGWKGNPINIFKPTSIGKASFANSVRLENLVKDGKIYLSLSDAIALAIENNYDIAIARYDLDIADTDILRTKTGAAPLGSPSGLVTGTLGGSTSILSTGGGPGGTTVGSGGAGSGVNGLTLTTAGAGPAPQNMDPSLTGTIQFDRDRLPSTSFFQSGTSTTNTYDATFNQGFVTGTNLQLAFDNTYSSSSATVQEFSPELLSNFKATVTQHLLQGAGIWINKRFMYQAENNRRITDSSFRQQILYTVNQVENIYWGLVQAYEDVQAKQRALDQSNQLLSDNQKQLGNRHHGAARCSQRRVDGGHGQAGADQFAERIELPAADHQAGHRPEPERCGAHGCAGDSHRPREPRADSGGEPAGGDAGAGGLPAAS